MTPMARNVGAAVLALLAITAVQAQKPVLEDLLRAAAAYQAAYAKRVSGTTLEEHYKLIPVHAGRMGTPLNFTSDVVLLNLNGRVIALRDPFLLDNVPLRERTPRITALLVKPSLESWEKAQAYAAEQHFRFMSDLIIRFSEPTVALQFLDTGTQSRVTWKVEGQKKIDGVVVTSLGFKETGDRKTRFILGTRGNGAASGRFLIDPATGAVHKSELWVNSGTEAIVVNVTYTQNAALGLLLPEKTSETYDWREVDDVASGRGVGAYGGRLFFQAAGSYSNARHTPVELVIRH